MKLVVCILNVLEGGKLGWIRYHCPQGGVRKKIKDIMSNFFLMDNLVD